MFRRLLVFLSLTLAVTQMSLAVVTGITASGTVVGGSTQIIRGTVTVSPPGQAQVWFSGSQYLQVQCDSGSGGLCNVLAGATTTSFTLIAPTPVAQTVINTITATDQRAGQNGT